VDDVLRRADQGSHPGIVLWRCRLFDYDGDGLLDIYLVTGPELTAARERVPRRNALYRNLGGWELRGRLQTRSVDLAAWGSGACVGDVDGDGRLDLYVTNWGTNALFRNRGDGTVRERDRSGGRRRRRLEHRLYVLRCRRRRRSGSLRGALRRDDGGLSRPRAATVRWRGGPRIMVGPTGLPGEADLFFENVGNGRFIEATTGTASRIDRAPTATASWPPITTTTGSWTSSSPTTPTRISCITTSGTAGSRASAVTAGVAVNGDGRAQAGMGADAGDYDGDLRVDLVLTTFAHDRYTLYRGIDGRLFEDATAAASPPRRSCAWAGARLPRRRSRRPARSVLRQRPHLFGRRQIPAARRDVPAEEPAVPEHRRPIPRRVGARRPRPAARRRRPRASPSGISTTTATSMSSSTTWTDRRRCSKNEQRTMRHWFAVRAAAPAGNRFAIGARVTISAGGTKQMREVRSGGSFLSQNDLRTYFGLGEYRRSRWTSEIRMPGGRRWQWAQLRATACTCSRCPTGQAVPQPPRVR
jgi:hypothetical protein